MPDRNLYLVTGTVWRTPYMRETMKTSETRIVWADNESDAIGKFENNFKVDDPYGTNVEVFDCVAHAAIE